MKKAKRTKNISQRTDSEKLDEIVKLLQFSIAIELSKLGSTQQQISKALGVATVSVNKMLQGTRKE